MKHFFQLLSGIAVAVTMLGCAADMAVMGGTGTETSREVSGNTPEADGQRHEYADVRISASLKTHLPGIYLIDGNCHGTDSFKLAVHIDGVPLQMNTSMTEEDGSYVAESHPESGKGIRYNFTASTRLETGNHSLTVSVPEDGISLRKDIHVKPGLNRIVLEPVYNKRKPYRKIGFVGDTSFYEGIKGFKLVVNGE